MGIVKQLDKRTGITYVYESKAFWDKEKHQSRAQRTLIGKIDPETGEMIPTDGRHRKTDEPTEKEPDYKKLYEKLLKKYDYPPKDRDSAVQVVMTQCELWADNMM